MRLGKRIGFIGLTLILAASLLTGCGDNNTPPNSSSSSSQPGQSSSGMENTGSSSSSTGSGTGESDDTTASTLNARSTKYFNRWEKLTHYTYKSRMEQTEGGRTEVTTTRIVTDGVRYSFQQWDETGETCIITDTKAKQSYYIMNESVSQVDQNDSMGVQTPENQKQLVMSLDSRRLHMPMTVGTTMVDGTLYYSETYEYSGVTGSAKYVYCFDTGDVEGKYLRYILEEAPVLTSSGVQKVNVKIKISENTENVDFDALRIPEGYCLIVNNEAKGTTPKDTYPN